MPSYGAAVSDPEPADGGEHILTIHEAAASLGVHYMTVYRYVRLGQLPATKRGSTWQIDQGDVERFRDAAPGHGALETSALAGRVQIHLLRGDEAACWAVLSEAADDVGVEHLYLHVLRPALHDIGERWASGEITVAQEHLASAVVTRLLGRLGHHLSPPGRRRGQVVIGCPLGDTHALAAAMFADLLRARGVTVVDLGADVPVESFERILRRVDGAGVVCLSVTTVDNDASVRSIVQHLRAQFPEMAVAVGGGAVRDAAHARARLGGLGARSGPGRDRRRRPPPVTPDR